MNHQTDYQKIPISSVQAVFLSQDDELTVRDEHGNRIKYFNQWAFYDQESNEWRDCYNPRAYGGGSYYCPPNKFFLCDK